MKDGKIIARAHNQTEKKKTFLAHAEMICIQRACKKLNSKYLTGCDLFVTLEPCLMCRTAAKLSRIKNIYYLTKSEKFGSRGPGYFKSKNRRITSPLTQRSVDLLQDFFRQRR